MVEVKASSLQNNQWNHCIGGLPGFILTLPDTEWDLWPPTETPESLLLVNEDEDLEYKSEKFGLAVVENVEKPLLDVDEGIEDVEYLSLK